MKLLLYIIILFHFSALLGTEVRSTSKKSTKTVSETEKLKNIKRYYPIDYHYYDRSITELPHPMMTGLFFNLKKQWLDREERESTPSVKYPFVINIYDDKKLTKKSGSIQFKKIEFKKIGKYLKLKGPQLSGVVTYKGEVKCRYHNEKDYIDKIVKKIPYTPSSPNGFVNYTEKPMDDLGCRFLNYFKPWLEVNVVHKNSYEIKQRDGSSIFLSKKEMRPYVYKTVKSDRDYLRDNKILTEKQLQQAGSIFEKLKKDLYKIPKNEFIKKYNLSYHGKVKPKEVSQIYQTLKGNLNKVSFFLSFKFDKLFNLKYGISFNYDFTDGHYISITFKIVEGKLAYNYIEKI